MEDRTHIAWGHIITVIGQGDYCSWLDARDGKWHYGNPYQEETENDSTRTDIHQHTRQSV
jgi:hypothetical protein